MGVKFCKMMILLPVQIATGRILLGCNAYRICSAFLWCASGASRGSL